MIKPFINNQSYIPEYSAFEKSNSSGLHTGLSSHEVTGMKDQSLEHFFRSFLATLNQDELEILKRAIQDLTNEKNNFSLDISDEMMNNIEAFKWTMNNWKILFKDSSTKNK